MQIPLRRDCVEKFVRMFESVATESGRVPNESETKAIAYFRLQLAAKLETLDDMEARVGSLKPSWDYPMTAGERLNLGGAMKCLCAFAEDDWQVMREYLAYKPRHGEKFHQVEVRGAFLRSPTDCLSAASAWARTHRKTKYRQPVKNSAEPQPDHDVAALAADLFKNLRAGVDGE